jgi:tetratricopeptide (TPR) repeat protein
MMEKYHYEYIFKNSKNSDELFDTFDKAVKEGIDNFEIYKILFWNPALSKNEVCMFVKKLAASFPKLSYDVYMWGAKVIELSYENDDNLETVITFYKKAAESNNKLTEPYIRALDCYNADLKIPQPSTLVNFVKRGVSKVNDPSILYYKLSELYGKMGNIELKNHYVAQGEKAIKRRVQI